MSTLGLVLLVALLIPIVALIVDSPIGRAIAGRLERAPEPGTRRDEVIADLRKRLELLEGDVEILQAAAEELREENQFVRRLLEEGPQRPKLPTDTA
jgi:hypothetical protein